MCTKINIFLYFRLNQDNTINYRKKTFIIDITETKNTSNINCVIRLSQCGSLLL